MHMSAIKSAAAAALCALALAFAPAAEAQSYPNKSIRIVVPYPAGGGIDLIARAVGNQLTQRWGQPVIIENKPGSGTIAAAENVAKSAPDGYTLMLTTDSTITINPHLYPKLPYDPARDFAPVTQLVLLNQLLLANANVPANTLTELIAYAKANPGKLSFPYASSTAQVAGETLRAMSGIEAVAVAYKSSPQAATDLISGQTQFYFIDFGTGLPHIKSGRMRALAATNKRTDLLPGVPAMSETLPGFALTSWNGVLAPAGTPSEVVNKLNAEMRAVLARPELRERLNVIGLEVMGTGTPEDFGAFLKVELAKWANWVKEAGIKPE
jgi:tripartite-type tricarboxylate transporter receptor subunit TctC